MNPWKCACLIPLPAAWRRAAPGVLLALLASGAVSTATADRFTGFNAGLEDWRITGDNASVWQAAGGNPGGCLDVNDLVTGDVNYAVAPPNFLGDWRSSTPADSLILDYRFVSGGPTLSGYPIFQIAGPGGAAHAATGYIPPQSVWTTKGVSLDPAGWVIESGSWEAILSHVTTFMIQAEFVNGAEEVQLDNIRLTLDPVPVFNPCENETFTVAGLWDWSFSGTGGVSNPESGGDSGGFCRIVDAAGTSHVYAPSRFLGDWSSFDGSGEVTVAIRLLSRSGTVAGAAEFIRLSGPGGTASVALTPADIPLAGTVWKTLAYPINAAAWTVTSGTWAGLLANVTECRLEMEWVSGAEITGFDNFSRRSTTCPAIDDAVTLHVSDVTRCGARSLIGVSGVALNHADGFLYGTVDGTTGAGLYRASGDSAGILLQSYSNATTLLCDAAGNVFVSNDNNGVIMRRTPAGAWSTWVSGFHAGDDDVAGMCFAPPGFSGPGVSPGDILVTDWGNSGADEIWAFSPAVAEGELLVMPDPGTVDIQDIATGPNGVVYAADELDSMRVHRLTPAGTLIAIPLSEPAGQMSSIVYDPLSDRIYVAAARDRTIRRINPASGAVELVASGLPSFAPCALELDSAGRKLWLASPAANRIYEFCLPAIATGVGGETAGEGVSAATSDDGVVAAVFVSPNPARDDISIRFALSRDAVTGVEIFDVAGRLVWRGGDAMLRSGVREIRWDGRGNDGARVASGIYMVRVRSGVEVRMARVIVAR